MCWQSWTNVSPERKVAVEDIKVYKIVEINDSVINSYFMEFSYGVADLNGNITSKETLTSCDIVPTEIKIGYGCNSYRIYEIGKGYHSFSKDKNILVDSEGIDVKAYVSGIDYPVDENIKVMECMIPKGTAYYENECEEIVSEMIEIKKLFDIKVENGKLGELY